MKAVTFLSLTLPTRTPCCNPGLVGRLRVVHVHLVPQHNETEILSRCTHEIGQQQPTREQVAKYWNVPVKRNYRVPGLDNSIMPWKIAKDGSVTNGLA